jgi:hypothetical protein
MMQLIAVLLSYPVGRCWARLVPDYKIFGVSLNPGDFTIKVALVLLRLNIHLTLCYFLFAQEHVSVHMSDRPVV